MPSSYVNSKFQGKSPTGCYFVLRPLLKCRRLQLVFLKLWDKRDAVVVFMRVRYNKV